MVKMSVPEKDTAIKAARREKMLEEAWNIFAEQSIENISMEELAGKLNCGKKTLYRYFESKPDLIVAVATWKMEKFREDNRKRRLNADFDGMTSAEIFEFLLESFMELYRNHKDLLRFNQFFNVYVNSEKLDKKTLKPYIGMIEKARAQFHDMYLKAEEDHTIKTDEPEAVMFSTTLHLMLAAATRYAVGLVYETEDGFDAEGELLVLKEMLLDRYRT